ncbi:MAG TPA: DUF58 domain-containing protein [Cyanobacteria bacterium UBA11149]|nr:DUF58 domain-containing protein [Cyanobacteria bacterium UBA11367]HBE56946.1 DUF58 domain-containing protein [Cyanobacteria bacterium UBA11366]HBK62175.1 DUF58 domain-containing protein [Cyanobacteria bacterium UBA11166]HBR73392.1 DUF58 domain-containing protein [Cyanobacteria bacterium UBA11159]HBS67640.1 DUF58 domain-containing protein [Cyanobacteria bacterium UBA11153]HBW90000.1 DUF58 domain-containing protein [Cyanobacteria bacterium UBA11149]HCA96445.1 DUF58 domain-containing protein 
MIPSQTIYLLLLLGIAIAILVANLFNINISLIVTLIFDIIVLGLAIWDGLDVKSHRIQVTRYPLHRLSIGRDNPVTLSLQSGNRLAKIRLRDYYPLEFSVSNSILETTLKPHSSEEITYTVNPHSRGEYPWGDIQVRQLGKWGLAWHNWQIKASQMVAVYPDLVGLRSLSIRLALENTGTMRQARRLGVGTEFAELREYGIGDDTRLIDWKATARRSRPLVRVLEPEKEQTLMILLDRGRLMTAQVQGLKRFDWGLNATLSLALAGLNRGDRVGIGVFDKEITHWIPPERGQHQLSKLIESLTPIQPVLLEPDYFGAVTKLVNQQTRRALVVLITDIVDVTASAELLAGMSRLAPRYLPFCVTLRDPEVDKLAHISTQNIQEAYTRGVALDLIAQRQVAFAQLKQKGVLVLDAPANRISDELVERYLQLKARNLL